MHDAVGCLVTDSLRVGISCQSNASEVDGACVHAQQVSFQQASFQESVCLQGVLSTPCCRTWDVLPMGWYTILCPIVRMFLVLLTVYPSESSTDCACTFAAKTL